MALRLVILQHYTKFAYKRLSGSGDIVRTKSGHEQTDAQIPI